MKNRSNIIKEKKNYFELNKLLSVLNSYNDNGNNIHPLKFYKNFLNMLVTYKIIKKEDFSIYLAFSEDLIDIGYDFTNLSLRNFEKNFLSYLKINSEFELYLPPKYSVINDEKFKLMNHFSNNQVYKDILLIVNYNTEGFLYLNQYIIDLYQKNFPNIVFIYPNNTKENNTISCSESHLGFYSYYCFRKVYLKYRNYKGYLYLNDDVFLKVWEILNLNFDIPWFYKYSPIDKQWFHYFRCLSLYNLFDDNPDWKINILQFTGYFDLLFNLADFYYLPNHYASKLCNILDKVFKLDIFLECAIPTAFGILSAQKYQIVDIHPLWGEERNCVINFLFSRTEQISIHPIKLSNENFRIKINQYILFINANKY